MQTPERNRAFAELEAAVAAYRAKFGAPPRVFGFAAADWPRLAALFREAVERGAELTAAETYRRLGREPPPTDAAI